MSADFRTLLSKSTDTIERPKPLPQGTYYGTISRHEFGESSNKRTPYVRFHLQLTGPSDDIDPDMMEGIDCTKKTLRRDFYLTEDALYRLKDFMESLGIETAGRSLGEVIPETTGMPVMISVTQRNSQDGKEVYNDVGDVVAQA